MAHNDAREAHGLSRESRAEATNLTYTQFLNRLATQSQHNFRIIRGILRNPEGHCPLSYVASIGTDVEPCRVEESRVILDLERTLAQRIVDAADDRCYSDDGNVDEATAGVRRDLLIVLGLQDDVIE